LPALAASESIIEVGGVEHKVEMTANVEVGAAVTDGIETKVDRAANDTRIAVFLAVTLGVGLVTGFGCAPLFRWWVAIFAGLGSMGIAVIVLRLVFRGAPIRRRVMALMHWITGQ
jgi:hypothetical protein